MKHWHCTKHAAHTSLVKILDATEYARTTQSVDKFLAKVISQLEAELRSAEAEDAAALAALSNSESLDNSGRKRRFTPADGDASAAPLVALPAASLARKRKPDAAPKLTMEDLRKRTMATAQAKAELPGSAKASLSLASEVSSDHQASDTARVDIDEDPYARRQSVGSKLWVAGNDSKQRPPDPQQQLAAGSASASAGAPVRVNLPAFDAPMHAPGGTRGTVIDLLAKSLTEGRDADVRATIASAAAAAHPSLSISTALDRAATVELARSLQELTPQALRALATAVEAATHEALASSDAMEVDEGEQTAPRASQLSVAYKDRSRALMHALRDPRNAALRSRLFAGEADPHFLATAPAYDLAPETVRAAHAALMAEPPRGDLGGNWVPVALRCGGCGSTDTEYQQVSAQRDIRKAEVWGTSAGDDAAFEVRCKVCGSSWYRDNI